MSCVSDLRADHWDSNVETSSSLSRALVGVLGAVPGWKDG